MLLAGGLAGLSLARAQASHVLVIKVSGTITHDGGALGPKTDPYVVP